MVKSSIFNVSFVVILCGIIVVGLDNLQYQILSCFIGLLIIIVDIIHTRLKTLTVFFEEAQIRIKYSYLLKEVKIKYSDIYEYQYIKVSKSPPTNNLKYAVNGKKIKISFRSIEYEMYIEFVKWLKSKNKEIDFTVFPSDNYMGHKLQEEFGFKYRKILKNTL